MPEMDPGLVGTVVGVIGAGMAVLAWLSASQAEARARAAEKRAKADEEAAKLEEERNDGPWFVSSREGDQMLRWSRGDSWNLRESGAAASFERSEVDRDIPMGTPIVVVMDNIGSEPMCGEITAKLDGEVISITREVDKAGSQKRWWISYPYKPSAHGLPMRLVLEFTGPSGAPHRHVYTTGHGMAQIARLEPPDRKSSSDGSFKVPE